MSDDVMPAQVCDPTARVHELLRWAYEGEVFGATFTADALREGALADRRIELETIQRLEERTRDVLAGVVTARQVTVDQHTAEQAGRGYAERLAGLTWEQFLVETVNAAEEALPRLKELRDLMATDPAMNELVDHEVALLAFARRARAGGSDAVQIIDQHLAAYA